MSGPKIKASIESENIINYGYGCLKNKIGSYKIQVFFKVEISSPDGNFTTFHTISQAGQSLQEMCLLILEENFLHARPCASACSGERNAGCGGTRGAGAMPGGPGPGQWVARAEILISLCVRRDLDLLLEQVILQYTGVTGRFYPPAHFYPGVKVA